MEIITEIAMNMPSSNESKEKEQILIPIEATEEIESMKTDTET